MKDLVTYIAKSITLEPEKIEVQSELSEDGTNIITITAPQSQVGRIIGKMGKTINALRTIIKSSFPNERFRLEIDEVPGEAIDQQISTTEDQVPQTTPETQEVEQTETEPVVQEQPLAETEPQPTPVEPVAQVTEPTTEETPKEK